MNALILAAILSAPAGAEHGSSEMSLGREAGVRFLGCEVLASGRIVAELSSGLDLVRSEAGHLLREAPDLEAYWLLNRAQAGPQSSLAGLEVNRALEALNALTTAEAVAERALDRATRLQRSFRAALRKELARGRDGQRLGPEADAVYRRLAGAAEALNAAAARLREAQDLLDSALARVEWALASGGGERSVPWRPWHANYRANGLPRPDYRLDLAARWNAGLEAAHHELHTDWGGGAGP